MTTLAERNRRLDALEEATEAWAKRTRALLLQRAETAKTILRGRTGSERLTRASVDAVSARVAEDIESFLVSE